MLRLLTAVSVGYCLTGWIGTAVVRSFGRDSLCYGLVCIALCWYFSFGRFVKDTPKSYQHDTNVRSNFPFIFKWTIFFYVPFFWQYLIQIIITQ